MTLSKTCLTVSLCASLMIACSKPEKFNHIIKKASDGSATPSAADVSSGDGSPSTDNKGSTESVDTNKELPPGTESGTGTGTSNEPPKEPIEEGGETAPTEGPATDPTADEKAFLALKVKGEAIIMRSCGECHAGIAPKFVTDNSLAPELVLKSAKRMIARIEDTGAPMPPEASGAKYQMTPEQKADAIQYLKALLSRDAAGN